MKKMVLLGIMGLLFSNLAYADITSNASPTIVSVSSSSPTKEVTFPITPRNISVFNYDPSDGLWINFRGGDTDGIGVNSSRFYLGPSSVISLEDYQTDAITIIYDNTFGSGEASPVAVIATY